MSYRYDVDSHWQLRGRFLVVSVRLRDLRIDSEHQIWIRRRPDDAAFWTSPLVLHELDHVRLSSDPRWLRWFEQRVREKSVLRFPAAMFGGRLPDRSTVERLVRRSVDATFEEIVELIRIRYRELDRLTRHGRDPVVRSAEIATWLDWDGDAGERVSESDR